MDSALFTGCATALVTPFLPDGSLDESALRRLIALQIDAEMDAIVLLGTTGEPSSLTMNERELVIKIGIEMAHGKLPIIVGTGSNDTRKAIEYARQAYDLGANAQLCVTPYYNKTTQFGLLRHYDAILDSSELPLILYNVPGRTNLSLTAQTVALIARHPNVIGIKEASADLSAVADIIQFTGGSLPIYCGNDDLIVPTMSLGASGAISVVSNLLPKQTRSITTACLHRRFDQARTTQLTLLPLIRILFSQVNPIPIKAALSMINLIHDELRLPLVPMDDPERTQLESLLCEMKLLC